MKTSQNKARAGVKIGDRKRAATNGAKKNKVGKRIVVVEVEEEIVRILGKGAGQDHLEEVVNTGSDAAHTLDRARDQDHMTAQDTSATVDKAATTNTTTTNADTDPSSSTWPSG